MTTFSAGEIQRRMAPQILHDLRNDKYDFMSVIPNAPAESIKSEGLDMNLITHNAEAEIGRTTAYADNELLELDISKGVIPWDSITTIPHKVTKDQMRAAVFDKNSEVRAQHTIAVMEKNREYVLNKLAAADNTNALRPVLRTTGEVVNGRKRLTVDDLIEYMIQMNDLDIPDKGRYISLCNEHLGDLLRDTKANQDFRNMYHNTRTGKIEPLYSFTFFWGTKPKILYTAADAKKAIGATKAATDQYASIFYWAPNTVKGMGYVTTHYKRLEDDTRNNPAQNEFRVTGYLQADVKQELGTASIVSGNA